jgi:inositol transport system substrate-binding protein
MSYLPSRFTLGLWVALAVGAATPLPSQADERKTILVSLPDASEPFMALMRHEAEDEAGKLGVSLTFEDGKGDSERQANDLETAVAAGAGIDGIILAPNDVLALAPAVNLALDKGKPIITVDRKLYAMNREIPHVGINNVFGGRMLAQWVTLNFPNGARILHLTGQPGSSSGIERAKGVRDELHEAGAKYPIVADIVADWSRTEAQAATETQLGFLKQPPQVIIADNDDMAIGALQGIHLAGADNAGIKVIGFDALPFALQKIREGALSATVDQQGGQQIRVALQQLVNQLRTGQPMKATTLTPILITADKLN